MTCAGPKTMTARFHVGSQIYMSHQEKVKAKESPLTFSTFCLVSAGVFPSKILIEVGNTATIVSRWLFTT